jgi:glycosyltransferase involved in cell wall biosynthesis
MRVSVVIPVYNLREFVGEAIESALGQTEPPFEVIVVNDCSTDDSERVIRSFGDRVRYIPLPANVGALRATLAGVEAARGDVLAFLDGDDAWLPTKLAKCSALLAADEGMILVSHQHQRVDRYGENLATYDDTHQNIDDIHRHHTSSEARSEAYKRAILEKRGFWLGSAYMLRRIALDVPGFRRWVDALPNPEFAYLDLTVAPFVLLENPTKRVGLVDERLFRYRVHGNNSCNDYRDVQRALRSVHRGRHTTKAVRDLLHCHPELEIARRGLAVHEQWLRYYAFLEELYLDRRRDAARSFAALVRSGYFDARALAKESARLALVLAGGPELFLYAKNLGTPEAVRARSTPVA